MNPETITYIVIGYFVLAMFLLLLNTISNAGTRGGVRRLEEMMNVLAMKNMQEEEEEEEEFVEELPEPKAEAIKDGTVPKHLVNDALKNHALYGVDLKGGIE